MKNNSALIVLFLLTIGLFVGCKEESSNYMVLNTIQYVENFPQTFSLDNGVEIDVIETLNTIGIKDFMIYDSLLVCATTDKEGFWSFFTLPDYRFLGKFITRGQGPYEFFSFPYVGSGAYFFKEKEELFSIVYHEKGRLYKMNVDESIKNNKLSIYTINNTLPPSLFNFVVIDSTTFFNKEINNRRTQQIRYMSVNGEKNIPPHFEKLNLAKIREGEDFNILSTITKYDFIRKRFVEMP
ncbi:MAG: hypothetical protein LBN11_07640, partial [Tannerella sp.]|nr:hypothetical protein [Tannerella sp.]